MSYQLTHLIHIQIKWQQFHCPILFPGFQLAAKKDMKQKVVCIS